VRQIPELRFFVAYVVQTNGKQTNGKQTKGRSIQVAPRIFYKDLSLAWRSASHFAIESDGEIWIGKGDVREEVEDGEDIIVSQEATTDLPLEIQTAVDGLLKHSRNPKGNIGILEEVLRKSDRVEPFSDFTGPRNKAAADARNLINELEPVAYFKRPNDPATLKIVPGFEPDFKNGIIEQSTFKSRLYGGKLSRFRILSRNQLIQYLFFAGPLHVWIIPPQALTTEISSYGVRTIDVIADDDLFIPGYEYHHYEETENGPQLYSQIPEGYVGEECPMDDAKADASPWLDKLPIVKRFRKEVLGEN
jgi:hypothetical protein